jgi:excisionase family DNA binding protein
MTQASTLRTQSNSIISSIAVMPAGTIIKRYKRVFCKNRFVNLDHVGYRALTFRHGRCWDMTMDDERLTLSVPEVALRLGLSRNGAYEAVAAGQIPAIRIGRRVLVPRVALERMLEAASKPSEAV